MNIREVGPRITWPVAFVASGVLGIVLIPAAPGDGSLLVLSTVVLVLSVALVVWREEDKVSPIMLTGFFYLMAYGLGAVFYWYEPDWGRFGLVLHPWTRHDIATGAMFSTAGWLALVAGYYALPRLKGGGRISRAGSGLSLNAVPNGVLVAMYGIGCAGKLVDVTSGRYFSKVSGAAPETAGQTGSSFLQLTAGSFTLLVATYLGLTGRIKLFWILAGAEAAFVVPTGSRLRIITLAVTVIVVLYYRRGRFPLRIVAVMALVATFVAFPVLYVYRNPDAGQAASLGSATRQVFGGDSGEILRTGVAATAARFSEVTTTAAVFAAPVPPIAIKPGQTYEWTVTNLIPRALWPQKPSTGTFGNDFARAYGVIKQENTRTGVVTPHPVEAYVNFGLLGGLLAMFCVGVLYGVLNALIGARRGSASAGALYAVLAYPIIGSHETIISQGLTGVLKTGVLLGGLAAVLTYVVTPRQVRVARPQSVPSP